jgi:hypothetical protein
VKDLVQEESANGKKKKMLWIWIVTGILHIDHEIGRHRDQGIHLHDKLNGSDENLDHDHDLGHDQAHNLDQHQDRGQK